MNDPGYLSIVDDPSFEKIKHIINKIVDALSPFITVPIYCQVVV
jgi:hypothetical protein